MEDYTTNTAITEAHTVITGTPTKDHPAGFRINPDGSKTYQPAPHHPKEPVHLMNKPMTSDRLQEVADKLAQRRTIWEKGAYLASNKELFALLADCYALYLHLDKFRDACKEFNAIYKQKGFDSTKATSLATKVVRYVFGEKAQKRTFAYAKVITIAEKQEVEPEIFPGFIEANGGIEEIRRNGADAEKKRQKREANIDRATNALMSITPLAQKFAAPSDVKLHGNTDFAAAIARKEADGTWSLVHMTANQILVEALLAQAARDGVPEKAQNESYVRSRADADNQ